MKKLLFVIILILLPVFLTTGIGTLADDIAEELFTPVFSEDVSIECSAPVINARAAVVMDTETGRVLFEKNAYTRMPMASTTKIMTAILAMECGNLEDTVKVSKRSANVWGSDIGLKAGQELSLREMLYGLLLNSGNDAAIAIAEHIGGTVEDFAVMMNEKARQIGAMDTSFKTPHGLDVDGHFTTAYDLALITRYALGNPVFSRIVGTKTASIPIRSLSNTNEMLYAYPGADGVKTGYTGKAGRCLVTSATRDNWRIISVVLGSPTVNARAQSSRSVLDYAFQSYKKVSLQQDGKIVAVIPVNRGIVKSVEIRTDGNIILPLTDTEAAAIEKRVSLPDMLEAPVRAGVEVGTVEYALNGEVIAESDLRSWNDVRRKGFSDYLYDIFDIWTRLIHEGMFLDM